MRFDLPGDTLDELREKSEVYFLLGLNGASLDPKVVTSSLRLEPDNAFAKGESFISRSGHLRRSFGLWQFSTKGKLETNDPTEHASYLLSLLEPRRVELSKYLESPEVRVEIRMSYEVDSPASSFGIQGPVAARLGALCNELVISVFFSEGT